MSGHTSGTDVSTNTLDPCLFDNIKQLKDRIYGGRSMQQFTESDNHKTFAQCLYVMCFRVHSSLDITYAL